MEIIGSFSCGYFDLILQSEQLSCHVLIHFVPPFFSQYLKVLWQIGVATFDLLHLDYRVVGIFSWLEAEVVSDEICVLSFKQEVNLVLILVVIQFNRKSNLQHAFNHVQEVEVEGVAEVYSLPRVHFIRVHQVSDSSFARIAQVFQTIYFIDNRFSLLFGH